MLRLKNGDNDDDNNNNIDNTDNHDIDNTNKQQQTSKPAFHRDNYE